MHLNVGLVNVLLICFFNWQCYPCCDYRTPLFKVYNVRFVKGDHLWGNILNGVIFREFKFIFNMMLTYFLSPHLRDVTIREQD